MIRSSRGAVPAALFAALLGAVVASAAAWGQSPARRGFSIAITAPANQEVIFGKTRIAADVKIDDPALIDRVEFLVGDEVIFVDREPPWECYHDFGEESHSWIVRAVAYHREGVSVSDAVVSRQMRFSTIEKVNRVILWVSARDRDGNFVTDLSRDDFRVAEDGRPQRIIDFYKEDRAITLAILIDTSGSMLDKIKYVHDGAGAFVDTLRPIDRALVIDFDDNVFLIQDLTSDHDPLKQAIESTEPLGATSIFDALHAAYRKIGEIEGRKAIVLLSDGDDTSSQFGFERVLEEAKTNNTLIYTIGLGGGYGGAPRKNVLKEFADVTGGRFFYVKKAEDLRGVYQQIADELGKQYYLSYSTTNDEWDGRWIKIDVQTDREGLDVRHRRGYFAVRKSRPNSSDAD